MATLSDLENTYLASSSSGPNRLHRGLRSDAVALIDAQNYFRRVHDAIDKTVGAGDAIYILGWGFQNSDFKLLPQGQKDLKTILAEKAQAGVDVRLMFWTEELVTGWGRYRGPYPIHRGNLTKTISAVIDLRLHNPGNAQEPPLRHRVLLDWSGPYDRIVPGSGFSSADMEFGKGTHHQKSVMVIAPDQLDPTKKALTGFTSGMELMTESTATVDHEVGHWHDIAAMVLGEAAARVLDNFRLRWDEAVALPRTESVWKDVDGSGNLVEFPTIPLAQDLPPPVPAWTQPIPDLHDTATGAPRAANNTVQVLQTFPMWQKWKEQDIRNGRDHVYQTLKKALGAAKRYVYIEDQYIGKGETRMFPDVSERNRLLEQLLQKPDIKLIMVASADASWDNIPSELKKPEFAGRLAVWRLDGTKPDKVPITVHSKLILIDDEFAMMGSANFMNRSLLPDHWFGTDTEISTAVVATDTWVRDFRAVLWQAHLGELFQGQPVLSELQNLDIALGMWRPGWNTVVAREMPDAKELHRLSLLHDPLDSSTPRILLNNLGPPITLP